MSNMKSETKQINVREKMRKTRTCKRPYSWYSPHSDIDIARNIKVGKSRKRK
jgi:hypothetical protein